MINNYGELQAAIASWLKRSELVNDIPGFISLAEDRFNRVIRTTEMETRSQANAGGEYIQVPDDFLQVRAIRFMGNISY